MSEEEIIADMYILLKRGSEYKVLNFDFDLRMVYVYDVELVDSPTGLEDDLYVVSIYRYRRLGWRRISEIDLDELKGFKIVSSEIFYKGSP